MTRATSVLFWFALTIIVSVALYDTSYRVQNLRHKLTSLNADIENERRNIHVLKAEWVYLANPARIEAAARKYLSLEPTAPKQIVSLQDLPERLEAAPAATKVAAASKAVTKVAANKGPQAKPMQAARVAAAALPRNENAFVLATSGRVP